MFFDKFSNFFCVYSEFKVKAMVGSLNTIIVTFTPLSAIFFNTLSNRNSSFKFLPTGLLRYNSGESHQSVI